MATTAPKNTSTVEVRTIDHVPENERHGKARDLFTVWFGSNIMLLTVASGVAATVAFGLPISAAAVALVLGHVVGGIVMALHAAQGPQMGVPQMLQTKAQFGSFGSLLVVVIVVLMYLGFFASNMVLGGQAISYLFHWNVKPSIVLIGLISVIAAIVGYKLIHALAGILSIVSGAVLVLAFIWAFGVNGVPSAAFSSGTVTVAGFMSTVTLGAVWQIAYAPYVSDYTRYMPKGTGVKPAFWATYSGAVLGSLFPMLLGAVAGAALHTDDTVAALSGLTHGIAGLVVAVFGIAIGCTNAMNLYCGALSTITVGQTFFPKWMPQARGRAVVASILFLAALGMALLGADNFLTYFTNFMTLLMCALIPWTAVNLVDYYLLRHGEYHIDSLFQRDGGRYGRINVPAVVCYVLGILIQLPFIVTAMFEGPIAKAMNHTDISWIVGLVVICPVYYVLMRKRPDLVAAPLKPGPPTSAVASVGAAGAPVPDAVATVAPEPAPSVGHGTDGAEGPTA
jgi:NCS1 family nucleobase:cation symporter-1